MAKKKKKPAKGRVRPPADITGEALAEWNRVVAAVLEKKRMITEADRSILTLHCRLWAVNQTCYEHVCKFGPIIKWPNGTPGPSPQLKEFQNTAKLMRGTLADLGCTPASRDFDVVAAREKEEPGELAI